MDDMDQCAQLGHIIQKAGTDMSKAWQNGTPKGWRKIRLRILARDNYCCQICGQTEGRLHIDHIIPKRLMGAEGDYDANLRTLCQKCNLAKGGRFFGDALTPPTLHGRISPLNGSVSHE